MSRRAHLLTIIVILLSGCGREQHDLSHDYFSFANTNEVATQRVELDLTVDFDAERLHGSATLYMIGLGDKLSEVILDTRGLDVSDVSIASADSAQVPVDFRFGDEDAVLGTPLIISLPADFDTDAIFSVKIEYRTGPNASALQWLPPELTAGGKHPFMFTQSQAIHARSWVPLQDTPVIRIRYTAVIRTPRELLAVMSANNDPLTPRSGEYHFDMPQPIPSYLLALAVGNIYFSPIGEQTGVYTEPEVLDAASFEFSGTQDMLEIAENLFGPYQWGRYDLLVLPPSFPYGGMENPRLSFITPSLLAGDQSLVSVIAHELAHSWSGNLVTNATWRDGWLNEGMTNYLESRLMEVLYGKDRVDEENVLGYKELLLEFDRVPLARQALAPPFETGDPDDFQGTIHYHKGQRLLQYLEDAFGRESFDQFLELYFASHQFGTITSEQFLDFLDMNLLTEEPVKVSRDQVEAWLYKPGLPADAPIPTSETLDHAAALAASWSQGEIDLDDISVDGWSPQAMVHFINSLATDLPDEKLSELDERYGLSTTGNAEISRTWFIQVAQRQHRAAYDDLERHLNRYGRTRLVHPVYRELAKNGSDLELARDMFSRARGKYHPITIARIENELKGSEQ